MNNYSDVLKNAKDLKEEFEKELSVYESLQIATQIQVAEVLSNGLQTGYSNESSFLEAIAMVLGYKKHDSDTILSVIRNKE